MSDDIALVIAQKIDSLSNEEKLIQVALTLETLARTARLKAERERRFTLTQLVDMVVTKLYDNRSARRVVHHPTIDDMDQCMQRLNGKIIALEGLIAAGKSEFVKKLAIEVSGRLHVKVLEEKLPKRVLDNFYADPARYAYGSQLMFAALRANMNDIAMAAAGLSPTDYPLASDSVSLVMADRTCCGDALFAGINYLEERMLNNEILAVIDAYPSNFEFSVILFLDVSAKRAEWVCKFLRKRPNERDIPLIYFQQLRLAHYALMRALALRGAPVLYVYCDDDPMTEESIAFLDPKEAIGAILDCPSGDEVKALWADTPEPIYGQTTEADVSDALETVRKRYLKHSSEHVRRVAHIRTTLHASCIGPKE